VKTRLIGPLSAEEACDLHRALVIDAWEILAGERFLYADQQHEEWRRLAGERLRVQRGADLGERMLRCFEEMAAAGFGPLLIVGSDTVGLTPDLLDSWMDREAALGPAEDGGYWAVGCQTPHPRMFEGVTWSSPETLVQTVAAMQRCGMAVSLLDTCYDVDTPEDLARLEAEPHAGPQVRSWLTKWRRL
jgi:rSAM/selenodomain-associated transferase 1